MNEIFYFKDGCHIYDIHADEETIEGYGSDQ